MESYYFYNKLWTEFTTVSLLSLPLEVLLFLCTCSDASWFIAQTQLRERACVCHGWGEGGREGGGRVGGWVTAQPQRHKNSSHQSRSLAQGHMQINWPAAAAAAGYPAKYNGRSSTSLLLFCPPKPKRHISITWIRQLIALQQVTEVVKALKFGQW